MQQTLAAFIHADHTVQLADPYKALQMLKLVELLEDLYDVQHVHANYEIDDATMDRLA